MTSAGRGRDFIRPGLLGSEPVQTRVSMPSTANVSPLKN